jgi:MFS transporter, putative metabolite:H+ symporter
MPKGETFVSNSVLLDNNAVRSWKFRKPKTVSGDPVRATRLLARLERIPFSPWHMRARIVMGSATFLDAFAALSLAFVLPILIGKWHMNAVDIGWLIAASYVGQLIGALIFSRFSETYGRIPGVIIATILMSIMSVACALVGSFAMLFACRFIQGIGVGGEMPVAATYIAEISSARGRGRNFMLYEMIFPVGLMATGQIAALVVPFFGWQTLFLVGGVPGIIIAILLCGLPESPRWLIGHGRLDEAEVTIVKIEASAQRKYPGFSPEPQGEAPAASAEPSDAPPPQATERGRWLELLGPVYRNRTLIAWMLWAAAYFVSNSLNNWMPTLCRTVYHMNLHEALRVASMTNVAQVALLLVCAFCIDRIGRRNWTVICFIIGGGLLALLALAKLSIVPEVSLAILAYGIIGSINTVLYLYTPEIYPTRMRAIGVGLSTSWLRLASAVGPALVGLLVVRGGIHAVFLMFVGVSLVGALAGWGMLETRNRQLEDIAR